MLDNRSDGLKGLGLTARLWIVSLLTAVALAFGGLARGEEPPVPAPLPAERMPADAQPDGQPAPTGTATESPAMTAPTLSPGELAPVATPSATTASQAAAALATELEPVHLTAKVTEDGDDIPEGLVWRVFDTAVDSTGDLALAAKSENATADIKLAPGQYVVHVAYGRAQASDTLVVKPGEASTKTMILDAGALRLNAAVTGDVTIPPNLLRFDVYNASAENEHTLVAQDLSANDVVTLNAGTYHIVSRFGEVNAVVRADLQVEPGKMTEATLYHSAAQVSFKLVTEPGGEAVADVEWTVQTADGTTVFSDIGAFPATVLAEGDYHVLAKRGDNVYNRDFEVQPGGPREIEVLTTVY